MKVYLGPFSSRWISRVHDNWLNRRYGEASWTMKDEEYTSFDTFVEKVEGWLQSLYNKTINKILDNRERKVKIHVDRYDVWNADHTIAILVHPILVKLKETSHGCPFTEDEDVPEELKSTSAPPKETEFETDDNHDKRWDWILGEMIWAFEQHNDNEAEDQFHKIGRAHV